MLARNYNYYKPKAVFLDRDGVINSLVKREDGRLTSPWNVKEFKLLPEVASSLLNFRREGFLTFIVTNQPGIEDGEMSEKDLKEIISYMREKLSFVDIRAATERNTIYYKPNNGMIENFIQHYNIAREKSFLIGDRWKDIVPGKNSGLTTILVGDTEYDPPEEYKHVFPDKKAKDISEACYLIMESDYERTKRQF